MKRGNISRTHVKNQKNQKPGYKSDISQNTNYNGTGQKYEKHNHDQNQTDYLSNKPLISYIYILLLAFLSLLFIDKYQFRQQKFFFEMSDDTPLAFKIENFGNEYLPPAFSKIFYVLIIDSFLFGIFSNLHCDLDFITYFILIITLESGLTAYIQSLHSLFFHTFLILFELYLYCVFIHTRAYQLKWYLIFSTITFLNALDFCLRVEGISFIFSLVSVTIISIHRTNLLTNPNRKTSAKEFIFIAFLCLSIIFIVLFTFYKTIGLPKFIWLPLSLGDILDEYKISQYNITLILIEIISLFFIKSAEFNSYNMFMICILLIILFSVSIIPAYSSETAVITKVFEFKMTLILISGIILGRQPRIYLALTIAFIGIAISWIYRYKFVPLDYEFI